MAKMHVMLVILAVVATTLAGDFENWKANHPSVSGEVTLDVHSDGGIKYVSVKLSDLVDSFIDKYGLNDKITVFDVPLQKGNTWQDYDVGNGTPVKIVATTLAGDFENWKANHPSVSGEVTLDVHSDGGIKYVSVKLSDRVDSFIDTYGPGKITVYDVALEKGNTWQDYDVGNGTPVKIE